MNSSGRLNQVGNFLYFYGLMLLAVSIPLSKFTMSISQFMIAGGWLISSGLGKRVANIGKSKYALLLAGIYLMHVIGLVYTSDFGYAFKDLRIKLPLLLLPLLVASGPFISLRQFNKILVAVVLGTTISTVISYLIYAGVIKRPLNDIRDISIFISHIRLVLVCCISVFITLWFAFVRKTDNVFIRLTAVVIALWHIYFIVLMQSITGFVVLSVSLFFISLYALMQIRKPVWRAVIVVAVALGAGMAAGKFITVYRMFQVKQEMPRFYNPELKTLSGNQYDDFIGRNEYENGYPVWDFVCEKELEQQWNDRSDLSYDGNDLRGQQLKVTLIRYLTSKGLKKDSAGLASLTPDEIKAIERGVANIVYLSGGSIEARIHQVLWEINSYKRGNNPSGHSVTQRLEYWKAASMIIGRHPWSGVGTGDVPDAFSEQYDLMDSGLSPEWRLRSHNQYLSIAVAFGIPGLLYFLAALFIPLISRAKRFDFLYVTFAISAIISMVSEDTLETQAGITYFTFFTCIFLLVNPQNRQFNGIEQQEETTSV